MIDFKGNLSYDKFAAHNLLVAAGTQTFAGVDLKDFVGTVAAVIVGTMVSASSTVVVSFLESSDNSTFATWAAAPTPVTITATNFCCVASIDTRATKRYVQAKFLTASTTATFQLGVAAVGVKAIT